MNTAAEPSQCLEFVSPIAVRNKLSFLKIPDAIFVKAAQRAFVEKANFQIYDPVGADGMDAWRIWC